MKNKKLTFYIFVSLLLGILFGGFFPELGVKTQFLATVFLNMIKMIIAPLLFATLVVGIAGHGDIKNIGKLGIKTIVYFEIITTIALFIGLGAGHIFQPGKNFFIEVNPIQMNMVKLKSLENRHLKRK